MCELRLDNPCGAEDMDVAAAPVPRVEDVMVREAGKSIRFIHRAIDEAIAEPYGVLCPEGLISADIELILDLRCRGGIQSVSGAKAIRLLQTGTRRRKNKLCPRDHSRADHIVRKCRTVECGAACVGGWGGLEGIVDRQLLIVVYVAFQFRFCWHQQVAVGGR